MGWRLALGISLTAEFRAVPPAWWGCGPVAGKKDPSVLVRKVGVAGVFLPLLTLSCPLPVEAAYHSPGTARDGGLMPLFPRSQVKADIWITSAAPHPSLGDCVQLLYVAGVWGSWHPAGPVLCESFLKGGVGSVVGFTPGHEISCFGISRTCFVYLVQLDSFACFLVGFTSFSSTFLLLHFSQTLGDEGG